ncbi:MAG: sensor histidine kinase, partial [Acidimicrobiales bacterium]
AAARIYRGREVTRLQREATRAAGALPASGLGAGDPVELPPPAAGVQLALYDSAGRRVAGRGPSTGGREVAAALRGDPADHRDGAWLAVAIPLLDEEEVVGAARAAVAWETVADAAHASWLLMAAFGAVAVALAGGLARWQSSRLVSPVQGVAALAIRLGEGDFTARLAPSGIAELDRATDALNRTAERVGDLVARERAFTADVSHQLTTPLTSLRLGLESALVTPGADATTSIKAAIAEVDRLQMTVTTLLAVVREVPLAGGARCDVAAVCREIGERCHGDLAAAGRRLRTDLDTDLPPARCPAEVLREILAVLVDNARAHGAGTVTVVARRAGSGIVVDVGDEGDGILGDVAGIFRRRSADAAGHGIGLALARSLAEAHGARLEVTRAAPSPVFTLALAGSSPSADPLPSANPGPSGREPPAP